MFRKFVERLLREELSKIPADAGGYKDAITGATDYAIIARIQNGYLISFTPSSPYLGGTPKTVIYCRDEKEIAEQLITHAARVKLSTPSSALMPHPVQGIGAASITSNSRI